LATGHTFSRRKKLDHDIVIVKDCYCVIECSESFRAIEKMAESWSIQYKWIEE